MKAKNSIPSLMGHDIQRIEELIEKQKLEESEPTMNPSVNSTETIKRTVLKKSSGVVIARKKDSMGIGRIQQNKQVVEDTKSLRNSLKQLKELSPTAAAYIDREDPDAKSIT